MRRRALTALALSGVFALFPAFAAQAHDSLVTTSPIAGTTSSDVGTVSLTFSNTLLDMQGIGSAFVIRVTDNEGLFYGDGCVRLVDDTMSMATTLGAAGEYTVTWRAVSTDGHPISEEYRFQYEPSAEASAAVGASEAPACGDEDAPVIDAAERSSDALADNSGLVIGLAGGGVLLVAVTAGFQIQKRRRRVR